MKKKYVFINLQLPNTPKEMFDYRRLIALYSDNDMKIIYGDKENYYNFLRSNRNVKAIYIHEEEKEVV